MCFTVLYVVGSALTAGPGVDLRLFFGLSQFMFMSPYAVRILTQCFDTLAVIVTPICMSGVPDGPITATLLLLHQYVCLVFRMAP